ncbi:hypothetical protein SLS62_006778 [Diatrype stigma]|uniref:Uncharacterized protein n=1 Tax=Diatrype stigma TaxID=117547 RepID=A0AAN9YMK3_9PEZI
MATTRTRRRVGGPPKRPQGTHGGGGGVRFVRSAAEDARLKRLQEQAKAAAATRAAKYAEAKAKGQAFLQHGDHRTTHQHKHPRPPGQPDDPVDDVVIVLRGVQRLDRIELATAVINEIRSCTQYSARRDPYSPRGDRVCRLWANPEGEAVLNLMAYPKGVGGRGVRFPTAGVAIPGRHGGPIYEAPRGMAHLYEYSSDDNEGADDGVHPNDVGTRGKVQHVFRGADGTVEGYQLQADADPHGHGRGEPAHMFSLDESHSDWDSDPGVHPPPGVGAVAPARAGPYKKPDLDDFRRNRGRGFRNSRRKAGEPGGKAPPPPGGAAPKDPQKKKKKVAEPDPDDEDSASSLEVLAQPPPPPPPPPPPQPKKKQSTAPDNKGGKNQKKDDGSKAKQAQADAAAAAKVPGMAAAKVPGTAAAKVPGTAAVKVPGTAAVKLPGMAAASNILAEYERSQQKTDRGWFGGLFGSKK